MGQAARDSTGVASQLHRSFDRRAIMLRAWAIFRATYRYPAVPFRSLGRKCFGWALAKAWHEAREAALIASIPTEIKAARIEELHRQHSLLPYAANYRWATFKAAAIDAELTQLAGARP